MFEYMYVRTKINPNLCPLLSLWGAEFSPYIDLCMSSRYTGVRVEYTVFILSALLFSHFSSSWDYTKFSVYIRLLILKHMLLLWGEGRGTTAWRFSTVYLTLFCLAMLYIYDLLVPSFCLIGVYASPSCPISLSLIQVNRQPMDYQIEMPQCIHVGY